MRYIFDNSPAIVRGWVVSVVGIFKAAVIKYISKTSDVMKQNFYLKPKQSSNYKSLENSDHIIAHSYSVPINVNIK